ncbi:hypothetical protein SAMN02787118_12691 [Streptomyces mirabilis]|jgi:hypothetical protein|uniref:Uncharacterized protein n=1 Tax=Streptomyces mirabilis TaxID=68239 RepID=A0A1I2U6U9_9ACTN|nr:hypothetical protein SAMN02787118_12691 [Streptomyces mirabilis]
MPELKRLHAGHAPAVLAFELANRTYFAASISDRGNDFFDQFTDRYNAALAEQEEPDHAGREASTQADPVPPGPGRRLSRRHRPNHGRLTDSTNHVQRLSPTRLPAS